MTRDNDSRFDLSRRSYIKGLGTAGLFGATGAAATGSGGAVPTESVVNVGEGSYITEQPADTQTPPSDPHLFTTDNVDAPLPSNDWWSGVHFGWNPYSSSEQPHSNGATIPYPYYAQPVPGGLWLNNPRTWTGARSAGAPGVEEYGVPVENANFVGADYAAIPRLVLGATAWTEATDTRTDGYGDWHVRARWGDDTDTPMDVTMARGLPFVFAEYEAGGAEISLLDDSDEPLASSNVTVFADRGNVLGFTLEPTTEGTDPQHYGLFAPDGATWEGTDGDTLTSDLAGEGYLTLAVLPDDSASTLDEFARYAYNVVTDTTIDWTYDQTDADGNPSSSVSTTYDFDFERKPESTASGTLTALLPNQWKHLADGQATMAYTYWSNRGTLKTYQGSSFTTELTYPGILPSMPMTDSVDETELSGYVERLQAEVTPYEHTQTGTGFGANEAYWIGKPLKRNDSVIPIADKLGQTELRDFFLEANRKRLTAWFDAEYNSFSFDGGTYDLPMEEEVTYYHTDIGSLITYPGGEFGAVQSLNDHHLQFGYFIYVASTIARYDQQWADDYGDMIELMVRDYANWERPTNNGQDGTPTPVSPTTPADSPGDAFPFLRTFSPYVGHSHAGGIQGNVWGANQESCSESIGAYAAMIRWGEVRLQQADTEAKRQRARKIRNTGIFLYTHEINAFWEYWFDADGDSHPDDWGTDIGPGELQDRPAGTNEEFTFAANTWGNGFWRSIYWQLTNPIEAFGINWIPMGGHSLYLGRDRVYADRVWEQYQRARELRGIRSYPDGWQQAAWGFRAMTNPNDAVDEMRDGLPIAPKASGDSTAHIYKYVTALSDLGLSEQDVTADTTFYRVFENGDRRTYVVDNPADDPITVTFSDGYTMTAAPGLSYESSAANYDALPDPARPADLTATNVTSHSVDVEWDDPTEGQRVLGYDVYFDGEKRETVTDTSASVSVQRARDGVPVPTAPVDTSGWTASLPSSEPAPGVVNGDGWASGFPTMNNADMRIVVDLGGTRTADGLTVEHAGTDFPSTMDVEVLTDSGWETVAAGAGGQATVDVSFSERSISKVRLDERETEKGNWWAINSLTVSNADGALDRSGWSAEFVTVEDASAAVQSDGTWSSGAALGDNEFTVLVETDEPTELSEIEINHAGADWPATFDLELYDGSSWTTVASDYEGAQTVAVSFETQTVTKFRIAETDDQKSNWYKISEIVAAAPDPTADGPVTTLDHTVEVVTLGEGLNESPAASVDITLDDTDTEPPARPAGLWVGRGSTTATLQWDATEDIGWAGFDHYNVYAGTYPDGEVTQVTDTTQTITGLSPDTSYEFAVTAVDANGNESAPATETVRMRADGVEQTPYGDGPAQIPGVVRAAEFDEGGPGVAYRDATNWDQGSTPFRDGETVDVDSIAGDTAVGWTMDDEWLEYTVDVAAAGTYDLSVQYVSGPTGGGGGSFSLELDDEPIGSTVELPQTADWSTTNTVTFGGLELDGGVQTLRLLIDEGGVTLLSMQFVRTDADDSTAPPTPDPTLDGTYHDSVDLSWTDVTDTGAGLDHYRVEWDGGSTEVSGLETSTTVTGLSPDTSYEFSVVAVDAVGNESDPSDPVVTTTFAGEQYPFKRERTAPTRIQAEDFDADAGYDGGNSSGAFHNQFLANGWTPNGLYGALGNYRAEQAFIFANGDGGYRVAALAGTVIEDGPDVEGSWWEYTVTVAEPATYELYISVANAETEGALSASIDGETLAADVTVPVTGGDEAWRTLRLGEYTFDSAGEHVVRIDTEVGNWSFDWLDVREPLTLSPPQSPAVDATTDTTVGLSWATPAAGEPDEYRITVAGGTERTVTVSGTETTVEGLAPNTDYEFQISAVVDGFTSAPTSPVSATTTIDTEYSHAITQPSNAAVDVTFSPESAVDAVSLQYTVGGGDQQAVDMNAADGTWSARITGLSDGASVDYAFVYERAGASRQTPTRTHAFSADTTGPAPVGDLAVADRTVGTVTLSWSAPAADDLDHYVVREGGRTVATTQSRQVTVADCSPATDYEFTVVAVDRVGNESSPTSASASTMAATSGLTASAVDNWLTGSYLAEDAVPTDGDGRVDYGTVRAMARSDGGEDE